jgi:small redox-active disulfide protein 2
MNIKVLGVGCAACRSMVSDAERLVAKLKLDARVEYVTDVEKIIAYGVMSIPVLVINEHVVMIGHRGAKKIEAVLQQAAETPK